MAVPNSFAQDTDTTEADQLALANSYYQMTQTAAWKDLMELLDELVNTAQQEHFSSRETEPMKIIEEKLRWQQRLLTKAAIENKVSSHLTLREEMLAESNEENPE